ncbi:MAG: response regulator [Calditrichaeota bacterium]|nr:MAG: response regulator [Calditrichota bacterium]MBL1204687.1 response regulator [Calditrichota bacterium]NOG44515.1 response regulator [Calditrichota bacterium]
MENGYKERILLADDEETFLYSTAELLRKEGFICDTAYNTKIATKLLTKNKYDLLISDIKMPDNPNLAFIKKANELTDSMSIILVTGYPTLDTAMQSIHLPISAYLVKPLDFPELLNHVKEAFEKKKIYKKISKTKERLNELCESFEKINSGMFDSETNAANESAQSYLNLTLQNISGSIKDIQYLFNNSKNDITEQNASHLFNSPKTLQLKSALHDAINVLEKTKSSFKSKELGSLRKRLEELDIINN